METLFERYVQLVVSRAVRKFSGTVYTNPPIGGHGQIPSWGLRYLEPDIMIQIDDQLYMADVKYKSHLFNTTTSSQKLKEPYRADLHQLLAYCSFEPQSEKTGILFYPSSKPVYYSSYYGERICGVRDRVILFGIPFDLNQLDGSVHMVESLLRDLIAT